MSNNNPSKTRDVYWLYALRTKNDYPDLTTRSGKWLIFVDLRYVNRVWSKIEQATEDGKLGGLAKVVTAKPNLYANQNKKVICVYTYDWRDKEDVTRVREELRRLGIKNKIPYKSDEDTEIGKYIKGGHKRVSKYYE